MKKIINTQERTNKLTKHFRLCYLNRRINKLLAAADRGERK